MKAMITRKNFLKKTGLLFLTPALFSISTTGCTENISTTPTKLNEFDAVLSKQKTFVINSFPKTMNGYEVYSVPKEVLYKTGFDKIKNKDTFDFLDNIQFVLRKYEIQEKSYFQIARVQVVEDLNSNVLISGINVGDDLIFNPREFIKHMASIDNKETKNRMLKKYRVKGGR